jgi:DNA-binding transcriptional ArsR family regulator
MILYMRTRRPLKALFPKTRQAILAVTLTHPEKWCYLAEMARRLGVPSSSLQRELAALVEAGILKRRRDGNRVYFQPDADCPFMPELQGLFVKTAGLVDVLREALAPLGDRIRWAFVYGSMARGQEKSDSDVDLMVIGDVGLSDVSPFLRSARQRLNREVTPTVYSTAEFTKKLHAGYGFHRGVLDKDKLFVVGNERELAAAFEGGARRSRATEQAGNR